MTSFSDILSVVGESENKVSQSIMFYIYTHL